MVATCCFFSCSKDFLEEVPDNRTTIDSPEKIKELLVNAYPTALYAHFTEMMSDNAGDRGSSRNARQISTDAYFWNENFHDVQQDSPEYFWSETYSNIAVANQALLSIEELGENSPELDALRAEARIARAYAHFMLVNLWAKQYDPATSPSDLGIPLVTETENVVFKDYDRNSVEEVYDFIEQELTEAIPNLDDSFLSPQAQKYHFNENAAHAFASRFYLYKGDWEKVVQHANQVLNGSVRNRLVDWNGVAQDMTYGQLYTMYTSPSNPWNLLVTEASSWWGRVYYGERYSLTTRLRDNVVRGSNPTSGSLGYRLFTVAPVAPFVPKFNENFVPTTPGGNTGLGYVEFPLFRVEEVLLNRAEAYAMLGIYGQAVDDLNIFYSKRIVNYNSDNVVTKEDIDEFYSVNSERLEGLDPFYDISEDQMPVIQAVVDARRVDYLHEGLRWFDIRRFDIEIVHRHGSSDNFEEQEPMILPADSPAHQLQIPETALSVLEPNPR